MTDCGSSMLLADSDGTVDAPESDDDVVLAVVLVADVVSGDPELEFPLLQPTSTRLEAASNTAARALPVILISLIPLCAIVADRSNDENELLSGCDVILGFADKMEGRIQELRHSAVPSDGANALANRARMGDGAVAPYRGLAL